jgi:aminopeptidase Y
MKSLLLVSISTLAASSAVQHPLHEAHATSEALIGSKSKSLVSSTKLQDTIKSANLLKRAKELYEIAKLGIEEYHHPTRVIGSKGN